MNKHIKETILALQHLIAMFGATTLVPLLTGLNPAVALFSAGLGTLIFHFVTKRKVPVFLGSSFAFIPGIIAVANSHGLAYAQGGIIVAGILYLVFALLIKTVGLKKVTKVLPSYVIGTIILIIGIILLPVAFDMAIGHLEIALLTLAIAVFILLTGFKMSKQFVILISISVGYFLSYAMGFVDFTPIIQASWFSLPEFTLPKFDFNAIMIIAPIVLATFMEHIGDITANGAVVGKEFIKDPGLHRTLVGDGLATIMAGFIGGPANTTYGENTGVLAVTQNYNPAILRLAAVFAIVLAFMGKIAAVLTTIPVFVLGGISLLLFGMIAKVGFDILKADQSNKSKIKILIIFIMMALAFSPIEFFMFSGVSLAALVGIILNLIWISTRKVETNGRN